MSKVITDTEVRLSYTNLLVPRAQDDEKPDEKTFSTAILIPKTDTATLDAMRAAIKDALDAGVAKLWNGKMPPKDKLRNPLRDGDEKEDKNGDKDETYAGMFFMNAKGPRGGKEPAILLDKEGQATTSATVVYSGVWGRVSVQFYAYDTKGNKGVACGISAFQSGEHGEALGNVETEDTARAAFGIKTPAGEAKKEFAGEATEEATEESEVVDPWGA